VVVCGEPLIELAAWVAHRRCQSEGRTANQLLTQLDRAFPGPSPGAGGCTGQQGWSAGRCALRRLRARLGRLGPERFREFAVRRGVKVNRRVAAALMEAARPGL
jgi:hypothetical protein